MAQQNIARSKVCSKPQNQRLDELLEAYQSICDHPTARDTEIDRQRAEALIDPDFRQETLDTLYEPERPKLDSYPRFFGWGWRRVVMHSVACAVLFVITLWATENALAWSTVPLYWTVLFIIKMTRYLRRLQRTERINQEREEIYEWSVDMHRNRPTVEEYKLFCQHYIGPNTGWVPKGDMVVQALNQVNISEEEVTKSHGKIYFYASFVDENEHNLDTDHAREVLHEMVVNVCVALRDSIVILSAIWDTTTNETPLFKTWAVMYNKISEFKREEETRDLKILCDGKVTASIAYGWKNYPSLFAYQSTDPKDTLTYSKTRTSDIEDFQAALLKLHAASAKKG